MFEFIGNGECALLADALDQPAENGINVYMLFKVSGLAGRGKVNIHKTAVMLSTLTGDEPFFFQRLDLA